LGLTFIYGETVLSRPADGKKIRISVIQGNIDKEMKRNTRKYAGIIMQKYTQLTHAALKENPDLVVWPEAATPGLVLKNLSLQQELVSLIKKADRHFLVGSSEYPKFSHEPFDKNKFGNTALFFSPSGRLLRQHLKIFLIPFGEYIPYEDIIPWPEWIVPKGSRARDVPGKAFTIFELNNAKFGVVICSEGAFPNLFRKFVKEGANFMLNITNEGWFGESALYQKVAASVFRAVENRIALARATNTGISCFIDPTGRVYGRVQKNEIETFVDGYRTEDILLSENRTFYTIYGNIFAFVCLGVTTILILLSIIRRK
jgi:apolipoprotein N-acyltransferase